MKIAFINDACERLGVEYISAVLKKAGHKVRLFVDSQLFRDENVSINVLSGFFDRREKIIREILEFNPDLVAISAVTDFYPWALEMAGRIKKVLNVPVIFGGIHPSAVPEKVIENGSVDMICLGEGEYPMRELAESMDRGEIDYSIENIWFKKDGKIIRNEVRPLIEDLDVLPFPDKELFYSQSPHFSICYYIMASRGCQYSCSYCCHSFLRNMYKQKGRYLRRRSVSNVIEELRQAKKIYHPKYVRFFDESLGADPVWLKEFSSVYRETIGIPFICYMHPHDVNSESVKCLKSAGCAEIEIGVQSMNEEINRNVLNRNITSETIQKALGTIRETGLSVVADNILGLPAQKREDILSLINYYNENRVNRIYAFWLRYYPRSGITEWAKEKGILEDAQYEDIMNGRGCRPFSRGGDTATRDFRKLQALISLIPFFPKPLITWLSRENRYRYLPHFMTPALLAAFSSLFSGALNDGIVHAEFRSRYFGGLFRRALGPVRVFIFAVAQRTNRFWKNRFFTAKRDYEYSRPDKDI